MTLSIRTSRWMFTLAITLASACSDEDEPADSSQTASQTGNQSDPSDAGRSSETSASDSRAPDRAAFEATGLNKYLGKAKPADTEDDGDETHYFFDEADGPVCLRGGRYAMATRERDSEDLVIYLQGGGSCTNALCRATETAEPKIPTYGVLNKDDADNPVAGWNVVFMPYCDGSLHFGDSDIPEMNRKHHGLRNVSAALDVAREHFPKPRRVLLTGASAGGYGTIWLTALVRLIYPEAKLFVFNDAGLAIANPANQDGFRERLNEWGAVQFLPASCDDCKTSAHLTPWMTWNLQKDPSLKLGLFSSYADSVIAGTFLMVDAQIFKQAVLDETAKVIAAAPERAKRFLVEGEQHTVGNLHTTAVGELSVAEWLGLMLDEDDSWDNAVQ